MTTSPTGLPPATALHGVSLLPHLGVIRAQGEEAAKFLHGQLTNDFSLLGLSEARLAGFCSAKGRLLASFIGFKRAHDDILLVCSADLLPATLKRLSMFLLRAKAKLSDASAEFQLWGLVGDAVPAALPASPWSKLDADGAQLVRLYPGAGVGRAMWVAPVDTPAPGGERLGEAQWRWLEVMSGVPTLSLPVVEAFVPQMLNLESVGGVNFKKGCYPGQEVVARSQFRGTLKRRAYVVQGDAAMAPGQEVFHDSDAAQPCGTVVEAAPHPEAGWNAIVSMQTSAAEGGRLRLAAADGPALNLLPLPYPLLADI
ncbi:MAG: folate-binding protein YgfZ [Hydrogenophaga sp.]|uniref:CAF17-like 4Fe-4S cluster assembly/insertion protein YgfZ n=1 Tax=Hydrogenophaga sp. TaxID=1904254 RepID=UPI0025C5BE2E|nr:folate-binding protein [Hydrogenophaga sp.]MBT9549298.1 folate-binding protein YgfZ [Hydrogenophaga sp.]